MATIHPFAPEVCNAVDDDCDGLLDELNPDDKGNRLIETKTVNGVTYTMTTTCADSSVGDCGLKNAQGGYSGRCVCSGIVPNSIVNKTSRVLCPGQRDDMNVSPKCFGATQPGLQTCDADNPRDEDCDGRTDAPDGKNLAAAGTGTVCGKTVGRCRAGNILSCDRSKLNPFARSALPNSAQGPVPGFNERDRFLVCDPMSGVLYPSAEQCNGFDDDCDGKLPGEDSAFVVPDNQKEIDVDGDRYLRCTGCTQVDNPTKFNMAAFRACNDCDDTLPGGKNFYPPVPEANYRGAMELCDGLSNQCATNFSPAKDDGLDQCGNQACCQGPPMCIDTTSSFKHCGSCPKSCDTDRADVCSGGACKCAADPSCDPASLTKAYCAGGVGCVQCRTTDADCASQTDPAMRICDPVGHRCVECVLDAQCGAGKVCDSGSHKCVRCTSVSGCTAPTAVCLVDGADPTKNQCVACVAKADCPGGTCQVNAADPTKNKCVPCLTGADCPAATPVCVVNAMDSTKNQCVACLTGADCPAAKPFCVVDAMTPSKNKCAECTTNAQCPMAKPACSVNATDASKNQCVPCLASTDCKDAAKPGCSVNATDPTKNQCVPCVVDANCTTMAKPACLIDLVDATKNQCVECTKNTNCPASPMKVCNLATNKCM